MLVIFDIRQGEPLQFAEKAHQRGVQIVLLTDQWLFHRALRPPRHRGTDRRAFRLIPRRPLSWLLKP